MPNTLLPSSTTKIEQAFDLSVARIIAVMTAQLPELTNQPK